MTDQPTLRDRIAEAMRGVDLAYFSRERANQVADAVMADVYGQAPTGDVATWTAIRAIQLANDSGRKLADRRLALSQALGLGTGAPWDAIQERAGELHLASVAEAQPAEAVLPAPVDRAAVLREAADDLATAFGDPMVKHIGILGATHLRRRAREIETGRPEPRRMADEAQQPEEAGR
ncbi:hypothetical protein ACWGLE_01275 [Streptomyces sp. NPDC055897]